MPSPSIAAGNMGCDWRWKSEKLLWSLTIRETTMSGELKLLDELNFISRVRGEKTHGPRPAEISVDT